MLAKLQHTPPKEVKMRVLSITSVLDSFRTAKHDLTRELLYLPSTFRCLTTVVQQIRLNHCNHAHIGPLRMERTPKIQSPLIETTRCKISHQEVGGQARPPGMLILLGPTGGGSVRIGSRSTPRCHKALQLLLPSSPGTKTRAWIDAYSTRKKQ